MQWYTDENTLADLASPLTKIFLEIGYSGAMEENSVVAVLKEPWHCSLTDREGEDSDAKRHARYTGSLQQLLQQYFSHGKVSSNVAAHGVYLHGTSRVSLESSNKAAKVYSDWMADLSELMDVTPQAEGSCQGE